MDPESPRKYIFLNHTCLFKSITYNAWSCCAWMKHESCHGNIDLRELVSVQTLLLEAIFSYSFWIGFMFIYHYIKPWQSKCFHACLHDSIIVMNYEPAVCARLATSRSLETPIAALSLCIIKFASIIILDYKVCSGTYWQCF